MPSLIATNDVDMNIIYSLSQPINLVLGFLLMAVHVRNMPVLCARLAAEMCVYVCMLPCLFKTSKHIFIELPTQRTSNQRYTHTQIQSGNCVIARMAEVTMKRKKLRCNGRLWMVETSSTHNLLAKMVELSVVGLECSVYNDDGIIERKREREWKKAYRVWELRMARGICYVIDPIIMWFRLQLRIQVTHTHTQTFRAQLPMFYSHTLKIFKSIFVATIAQMSVCNYSFALNTKNM